MRTLRLPPMTPVFHLYLSLIFRNWLLWIMNWRGCT
ncbi:hypothetical protein Pint_10105 [Pistacia integerrima]|uniref:Uncharacterized protein n=1 Tax=Pistacia integerrima TaxID=434235 RepID=A0ACC0XIL6_9ROSI|nr:hypothetical protein Pint_10105 [Pistacia integerrima]